LFVVVIKYGIIFNAVIEYDHSIINSVDPWSNV